MSALGLLSSPLSFEISKFDIVRLSDLSKADFTARLKQIAGQTTEYLRQARLAEHDITVSYRLDMRYYGQGYEVDVSLPADAPEAVYDKLPRLFADAYARVFAMSNIEEPIEIVNWKVEARGPLPPIANRRLRTGLSEKTAEKGTRSAFFPEFNAYRDCPVYDRYALRAGDRITGPAFIEENESTCVIGVGDVVTVDSRFNLIAELSAAEAAP
jgi:N-methylhydantoinase A